MGLIATDSQAEPKIGHGQSIIPQDVNGDKMSELFNERELVLKTLRILVADLCEQFDGGHPGGAIGMMAIGTALWRYVMKFSPNDPQWFNRDRFVLSNGHACLLQYIFLHMTGYHDMTLEQLKSYHSDREDSLCPGHPEIEHEGIELTTGPLGQGLANAVGLAIATKHLAATYNKPGYDVVNNHTWCMVGDACLQEGVGLEAISYAGHMQLNNLTVIYDNNQVTCDGSVNITNTEDVNAKMCACGWNVIDVSNGNYDVEGLVHALEMAKRSTDKPTFINVRTTIGLGSAVAGKSTAHGSAFGAEDVANMKIAHNFDPDKHYVIDQRVRDFFAVLPERGNRLVANWNDLLSTYSEAHPELSTDFKDRMAGKLPHGWKSFIPPKFDTLGTATRAANGLVMNPVTKACNSFIVSTADLAPSTNLDYPTGAPLNPPSVTPAFRPVGNYAHRFLHLGVREHAMCAISNGLAAFHRGTIIPITSTFFMFYLYAAPAVRMGALQHLQVLHVATHDSIGMGEDGPTHQPLELAALYRAMPNLLYFRPADNEETAGAWEAAVEFRFGSSIVSTSRHKVRQFPGLTSQDGVKRGAYVVREARHREARHPLTGNVNVKANVNIDRHGNGNGNGDGYEDGTTAADLTIIGVGAEFEIALATADKLEHEHGLRVRVVSFPCQRLFDAQSLAYRRNVLGRSQDKTVPSVVIEAYVAVGWERYADAAVCMSTARYGKSLPGPKAYAYFGFTPEKIVPRVLDWLERRKRGDVLPWEFEEIYEDVGGSH